MFEEQGLHGNIVFTSSANAVVAKRGSEAYDVSKAALSHLIRELAVSLAPNVRVNGISPATVVKGSTMFPRDRVRASLTKYNIPFQESFSDEELRSRLAAFYAERTLTHKAIDPADCAEAILFLASPRARCTTGHVIPVDGGLTEAFRALKETGVSLPSCKKPARVAIDLGAESCRVSLLRWIGGDRVPRTGPGPWGAAPNVAVIHRIPNGPVHRGEFRCTGR